MHSPFSSTCNMQIQGKEMRDANIYDAIAHNL